jgi:PAS domain S-box-containing protein
MVPKSSENESSIFDLEEFFNSFLDLSEEAFIITDKFGKIIKVNSVFTEFSGYKKNELEGKEIAKYFQLHNHENHDWNHILSIGCPKTESQLIQKNGFKADGCLTVKKVNGNAFIFKWDGISADISRLNNEHVYASELKKTINKFTTLIDNSRDVLYSIYYNTLVFEPGNKRWSCIPYPERRPSAGSDLHGDRLRHITNEPESNDYLWLLYRVAYGYNKALRGIPRRCLFCNPDNERICPAAQCLC